MPENTKYNSVQEVVAEIMSWDPEDVVLFLDKDGTTADFNDENPDKAMPPEETLDDMHSLYKLTKGGVVINTGRTLKFVRGVLGHRFIPVASEHGAQVCMSPGDVIDISKPIRKDALNAIVDDIFGPLERDHGIWIQKKDHATAVHHSKSTLSKEEAEKLVAKLSAIARDKYNLDNADLPVKLVRGRQVTEFNAVASGKDHAVRYMMQSPTLMNRLPFFIGDSDADAPGMEQVHTAATAKGINVRNSIGVSAIAPEICRLRLPTPEHARQVLRTLAREWQPAEARRLALV